jgi:N4-gp56 family major capsid protein
MPDAYTVTTSGNTVQRAYELLMRKPLRQQLYFDRAAEVKPTNQSMAGKEVTFTIKTDMAVASTALNESVDVDAVALTDSQVTVPLVEYGNAAVTTAKLRGTSFASVDAEAAETVGFNAGESQDAIAVNVLRAGSNVRYATGGATDPTARNTIEPSDILTAHDVRVAATDLAASKVMRFSDGLYRAYLRPEVVIDLREETGAASWRDPHTYSQPGEIWNGTIGAFEGFSFIETPNPQLLVADAGSSTTLTDVFLSLFVGREALAKAWSSTVSGPNPQVVLGPAVDKLKRFHPVGWYWLAGYGRFREAAIRRVESSSSIGVNA